MDLIYVWPPPTVLAHPPQHGTPARPRKKSLARLISRVAQNSPRLVRHVGFGREQRPPVVVDVAVGGGVRGVDLKEENYVLHMFARDWLFPPIK